MKKAKEIDMKKITVDWLNGKSNNELVKQGNFNGLPKLYHMLRGFLFSVAKENPGEMIKLVEKSKGKFGKRIMDKPDDRLKQQIQVVKLLLNNESMVQIADELKISYTKVQKLFIEFLDREDIQYIIPTDESIDFILANYNKEIKEKLKRAEKKWAN